MSWSLLHSSQSSGKTYARPLGLIEASFYLDRIFNGTSDMIWRYIVQETDLARGHNFFSESNVKRAWSVLKRWYPLLGARMDEVKFVVSEQSLYHHHPDEVTLSTVSSSAEVDKLIQSLLHHNPMSDHHLISRLFVFTRQERPGTHEVLIKAAHSIADGISQATITRTFFDVLVSSPSRIPPLEERLTMALPYDQLNPTNKMSTARQRWRRAIAQVTFLNRRRNLVGGHTIVRTVTDKTYRTPATSDSMALRFSQAETAAILDACKRQKLTFGAVIPVISQLAHTRVLHRRYFRGEIPEDEWESRRRQPMHFGGPIDLRPYMDAQWLRKGGDTEVALIVDLYECTLPFMPTPFGTRKDSGVPQEDGAPPYSALLSHARFFHRARLFKTQLEKRARHPLIPDIALARQPAYTQGKKMIASHWLAEMKGEPLPSYTQPSYWDSVPPDFVLANVISSVGQMSHILPKKYPLPPGHPLSVRTLQHANPIIDATTEASGAKAITIPLPVTADTDALLRIIDGSKFYMHARPMHFLLSNATEHDQIVLFITFDANVYSKAVAAEFIDECRRAALFYLGADAKLSPKL